MEEQDVMMDELYRQVFVEREPTYRCAWVEEGVVQRLTSARHLDITTQDTLRAQGWHVDVPVDIDVGDSYVDGAWVKAPPVPVE